MNLFHPLLVITLSAGVFLPFEVRQFLCYRVNKKRAPTSDARHFLSYVSNLMKIQTQLAHYILHIMLKHNGDRHLFYEL